MLSKTGAGPLKRVLRRNAFPSQPGHSRHNKMCSMPLCFDAGFELDGLHLR